MSLSYTARCLAAGALCLAAVTTFSRAATAHAAPVAAPPATPGCGRPWAPGTDVTGTLISGGVQRIYLLHIPKGYRPTAALPLVLNLPGSGMTGQDEEEVTHMASTADTSDFQVVY